MQIQADIADPAPPRGGAPLLPLCVDLDGTLVHADTFDESVFLGLRNWRVWRALMRLPFTTRQALKKEIAEIEPVDPALLPYNEALLAYLRSEKAAGRELVLVTASDSKTADAVGAHLGLFDRILASDGVNNLKGAAKAEALIARYGEKGFVYAGNDRVDLHVWEHADAAIIVNATPSLIARAETKTRVEARFDRTASRLGAAIKALRPYQWVKNILVFTPIVTAQAFNDLSAWTAALWTFAAFCAAASGNYVINDLFDIKADRLHPRKRRRPFASGTLPVFNGLAMAIFCIAAATLFSLQSGALELVAVYAALTLSYSFWLKLLPLVDVFVLSGLYTLRLFAGGETTGYRITFALLGFSSFLFLSLALVKRVSELATLKEGEARRGYMVRDIPILQIMQVASGFTAAVILALFVQNEAASQNYASPGLLWCTVPLILFWLCRIWLSTARGYMHDDPILYAARDWVSWLVVAGVFCALIAAKTVSIAL